MGNTKEMSPPVAAGRLYNASVNCIEGDMWLHVTAPDGLKGSINLSCIQGLVTRLAFIRWAKSNCGVTPENTGE